jgi:putative acetyltransferase
MLPIIIRDEEEKDYPAIKEITIAAFTNHPYSRNTEHLIIEKLRENGKLSVSMVAQLDDSVVGHVAFSPAAINNQAGKWYGAGPLSVVPQQQRKGIGSALMQAGIEKLRALDAEGCVLVGNPDYYIRFGFCCCEELLLPGVPAENFMALSFTGKIPKGEAQFDEAFFVTE